MKNILKTIKNWIGNLKKNFLCAENLNWVKGDSFESPGPESELSV